MGDGLPNTYMARNLATNHGLDLGKLLAEADPCTGMDMGVQAVRDALRAVQGYFTVSNQWRSFRCTLHSVKIMCKTRSMNIDDVIKDDLIHDDDSYLGNCRGCGNPLEVTESEIHNGPRDQVHLTCTNLGTPECVTGEWFEIHDLL